MNYLFKKIYNIDIYHSINFRNSMEVYAHTTKVMSCHSNCEICTFLHVLYSFQLTYQFPQDKLVHQTEGAL